MTTPVLVGPVQSDGSRVTATVDGEPLWFESADADLDASAEALAGTVILAGLTRGRATEIADPVSRVWLDNVGRAQQVWHDWWGYPILPVSAPALDHDRSRAAGTALCFTGGVDSFHTLMTRDQRPDILAFVRGFMVSLDNDDLGSVSEQMVRDVATAVGARAVVLRTNLWSHHLITASRIRRTVGGGLVAPGHLLAGEVERLVLSSGPGTVQHIDPALAFGTHRELDPLWSSDRLTVEHYGADRTRFEKLGEIADHDLVRRHLRVCNQPSVRNCSTCDKCTFTMTLIAVLDDDPAAWDVFDWHGAPLAARLDRINKTTYTSSYPRILDGGIDPQLARAIRDLLERTARTPPPGSFARRLTRRVRRAVR